MALTEASMPAKRRILTTSVRCFLEHGYTNTTMSEIVTEAKVSNSSFQNIFRVKEGILTELVTFMFESQFGMAREIIGEKMPPVYVYALETAIQLTLTELNDNLRDVYCEAYSGEETSGYIRNATAWELYEIFGSYQPELSKYDFYTMDIGSMGLMRNYMAYPCNDKFTLEIKIKRFLEMSLRSYAVPQKEQEEVIRYILRLPIVDISEGVMKKLFESLAMKYEFSLKGIRLRTPRKEQTHR